MTKQIANTPVYLRLFNGCRDFSNPPEDWELDGPLLGPFKYVHVWGDCIFLEDAGELHMVDSQVYYDGVLYWDWTVFSPINPVSDARRFSAKLAGEVVEGKRIYFRPKLNFRRDKRSRRRLP